MVRVRTLIADSGSGAHPYFASDDLLRGPHAARNLADAVHLLCGLHGRHPGLIELALTQGPDGPAHPWLAEAAEAFERERLYLVRLTAAVGLQ